MAPDLSDLRLARRLAPWSDLGTRVMSAAVLAPLALVCLWLGAIPWAVLVGLASAGLALEWVRLCGARALAPSGIAVVVSVLAAGGAAAAGAAWLGLAALGAGAALAWAMAEREETAARLAAGVPYIGLAGIALIWLRRFGGAGGAGGANVLFVVLVVWAADIGAYLVGRWIGGPKLAPRISPGKTRAGAAGGLLAAVAVGLGVAQLAGAGHGASAARLPYAALVAAGLGIVAEAGDLLESAIKRRFGVKDSGRLIPGHGGLLDRLDGMLAAAPAAAGLALALGRGVLLWE